MARLVRSVPVMPFGKYRGERLDVVARDSSYADWLVDQHWFKSKYASLFELLTGDPRLAQIRRLEQEREPIAEQKRRALATSTRADQEAQLARWHQQWLDRHKVAYEPHSIMPFGKHKGRPLAEVARDESYFRWFVGSTYARMNPELAADLKIMVETVASGRLRWPRSSSTMAAVPSTP